MSVVEANTEPEGLIRTTTTFEIPVRVESRIRPLILMLDRTRDAAARSASSVTGSGGLAGASVVVVDGVSGDGVGVGDGSLEGVGVGSGVEAGVASGDAVGIAGSGLGASVVDVVLAFSAGASDALEFDVSETPVGGITVAEVFSVA